MSYVITIKAASVERELEIFPQQGNNEEDSSNKKNRNEDERQNLLFLPLLIPIVRKFWFQTSLPRPYQKRFQAVWRELPAFQCRSCSGRRTGYAGVGKRQASHRFEGP
jgi:hypothetical protein